MKDIITKINEALNVNSKALQSFKKYVENYGVSIEGPDTSGILYITPLNKDLPYICLCSENGKYWTCFGDENDEGIVEICLNEPGTRIKKVDVSEFERVEKGFSFSKKNAELLANAILNYK